MVQISGHVTSGFEPVRKAFEANFSEHGDVGACFSVFRDGNCEVDLWGGFVEESSGSAWEKDTIINVYSSTKTVTALCALVLADRGDLDFSAPVAKYWPEFAAAGKQDVLVSHLMAHQAGLSGIDVPVTVEDVYDWDKMASLLAAQAPWWKPGSASGYHAVTQGNLIGEVIRRIDGRSIGTFLREEIAGPLDVDFHIGLPEQHDARVANVIPPDTGLDEAGLDADSIAHRSLSNPLLKASDSHTRAWRQAEIPAAGGIGNARALARIHQVLACGGEAFGKSLLSEAGARRSLEVQTDGIDLVFSFPLRHGLGFGLGSEMLPLPSPNMCFWGGWGGSLVMIDYDNRMSFAYVMNRMDSNLLGDPRGMLMMASVYESLAA